MIKKSGLLISLFISIILICINLATVNATAQSLPGYLVDENFTFLSTSYDLGNVQLSGWDTDTSGGKFSYSYASSFTIKDTSSTLPVTMNRKFNPQTEGVVTLEYRFLQSQLQNDVSWKLRDGTNPAIEVTTNNGYICYKNSLGQTVNIISYVANAQYGIKIVADITGKKASYYVNGYLYAQNIPFITTVSKLDNLYIKTGDTAIGDMNLAPICIYKNYMLYEKFLSTSLGTYSGSSFQKTIGGGTVSIVELFGSTKPDTYSMLLDDTKTTDGVSINTTMSGSSSNDVFEYKFLLDSLQTGVNFELKNSGSTLLKITTSSSKLKYITDVGSSVDICDFKANLWYWVKVKLNNTLGTADIYVNGRIRVANAKINVGNVTMNELKVQTPVAGTCKLWLDDIFIYNDIQASVDYPTSPVKLDTGNYIVGMQSCSLWREGNHLGWDRIKAYPEREPYLGYYDEGNPETADWEIKWLAEHGVSYELFCWFRPSGGVGAIKDPFQGFALHDGYLNAKYSDKMNYAIMWENGSSRANDSADFRNNIVPFWIEYYFKDARYQKINNKPVLSIYSMGGLERDFGTTGVKAEIDYLRSACISAGFDGITLLSVSNSTDSATLTKYVDIGVDSLYSYSWGAYVCGNPISQEIVTKDQRDVGVINILPTLSMGRDDSAWGGSRGKYITPSELKGLANWAKNTYMPSLTAGSLGTKMVMLDDLNEYGEGHFMMPAKLAGFGYLDAIGETFGNLGTHSDVKPTDTQKARINALYPQDRQVTTASQAIPTMLPYYKKAWQFTSTNEGFTVSGMTGSVSGGYYNATSTSTDPIMYSPDNLLIDTSAVQYIKIKMKNQTKSSSISIYFVTTADTTYNEAKNVGAIAKMLDDGYTEYTFEMFRNSKWTGTLKRLRFDLATVTGNFSVDYIVLIANNGFTVGENIIPDSSFEGSTFNYSSKYETDVQFSKMEFNTGNQALKCTKKNVYGSLAYNLPLKSKKSYLYSIYAKLPFDATQGQVLRMCLAYTKNGSSVEKIIGTSDPLTWDSWKLLSGVVTIDDDVTSPKLYFFTDLQPLTESYYVDDFEVREIAQDYTSYPADKATNINRNENLSIALSGSDYVMGNSVTVNNSTSLVNPVISLGGGQYNVALNTLDFDTNYSVYINNLKNAYNQTLPVINFQFTTQKKFDITLQGFYKNFGTVSETKLTNLSQATGTIEAFTSVHSNSDVDETLKFYTALYNNNKLIGVNTQTVIVPAYNTVEPNQNINFAEYSANKMKLFLWDGFKPIGYSELK